MLPPWYQIIFWGVRKRGSGERRMNRVYARKEEGEALERCCWGNAAGLDAKRMDCVGGYWTEGAAPLVSIGWVASYQD